MSGKYTEAQKKATLKHLNSLKEVRFRVKPEDYERYQESALNMGYDNMRPFFLDAIEEKINNFQKKETPEE